MNKIITLAAICFIAAGLSPVSGKEASDPHMTPEERGQVVKLLVDSEKELLDSIQDVSDAQWNYRPGPFRWTLGQVAEHIVLAEGLLYSAMERALAQKPNPDWEAKTSGKTEFLERAMPSRARKAQAPEEIQPSGKLSRDEVIRRYKEIRGRTLKFARETGLPLKEYTYDHPFPVFNTLNAYQWLIYIPLHNMRHDKQIAEIKASPGYPK